MLLLALAAGLLSTRRLFEVFALSAVALGLNALLVGGLVRWLGDSAWNNDWLGRLLLIGLFAAGLLGTSVSAILRLSRHAVMPAQVRLHEPEPAASLPGRRECRNWRRPASGPGP